MNNNHPKYPYVLAIILGLLVPFLVAIIPDIAPQPIPLALMYLTGESLFGYFWPKVSWRWGLWIVGPMIVFIGLSVLFAGPIETFLKNDLPVLLLAVASASLGSFLLARFKYRRAKLAEK